METIFNKRRSVNYFDKTKEIKDSELMQLFEIANLCPSAFNLQPWRIIIVKSEEMKRKLYELSDQQSKILEAPISLMIIANKDGWSKENPMWEHLAKSLKNPELLEIYQKTAKNLYGLTEERKLVFSVSNASLFAMSLMYAATYMGLDTHPMSGFDYDGIRETFKLKENEVFVMNIAIGYFDNTKKLHPRAYRRKPNEMITFV